MRCLTPLIGPPYTVGGATPVQERMRGLEERLERRESDRPSPTRASDVADEVSATTASTDPKMKEKSASTSSGSTFEERLQSKLSQSTTGTKPKTTESASTSSGNTFEERLKSKLSHSTDTSKPKKTASASAYSGSTFEERLRSKLSQSTDTSKPNKIDSASISSGSTFEERLHSKLISGSSDPSADGVMGKAESPGGKGPVPEVIPDEAPPRPTSEFDDSLDKKTGAKASTSRRVEPIVEDADAPIGAHQAASRFDDSLEKARALEIESLASGVAELEPPHPRSSAPTGERMPGGPDPNENDGAAGGALISHSGESDVGPTGPARDVDTDDDDERDKGQDGSGDVATDFFVTEAYPVNSDRESDDDKEIYNATAVPPERWAKRHAKTLLFVSVGVIVALIVLLGIGFGQAPPEPPIVVASIDTPSPTLSPSTDLEGSLMDVILENSPEIIPLGARSDNLYAHRMALKWMASDQSRAIEEGGWTGIEIAERYALAMLFYATGGEDWESGLGFLSEEGHICEWNGRHFGQLKGVVGCTNSTAEIGRRVTKLTLCKFGLYFLHNESTNQVLTDQNVAQNGLDGPLPAEIGLLTELAELNLAQNDINGHIPRLQTCAKLETIDLGSNDFEGDSSSFEQLERLRSLDVSNNELWGSLEFMNSLPSLGKSRSKLFM